MQEIFKQTGIKIERRTRDDPELHLDLQSVTFWKSLDTIAVQAKASVSPYGGIALVDRPAQDLKVCYDGIFRLAVKKITAVRNLETGEHFYTLAVEVAWEPGFEPLWLQTRPQNLEVRGAAGQPWKVNDLGTVKAAVDNKTCLLIDDIIVPAPDRPTAKISLLKGSLSAIGPSKMLTFDFGTLSQLNQAGAARRLTQEQVTVDIRKIIMDTTRYTVQVAVQLPPDTRQFDSFEAWWVNNDMYLLMKDGKRFTNNGGHSSDSAASSPVILSYHFIDEPKKKIERPVPATVKLIYRCPAKIIDVPIAFEFKDLPLP